MTDQSCSVVFCYKSQTARKEHYQVWKYMDEVAEC